MDRRLRRLGGRFVFCVGVVQLSYQAVDGRGLGRIFAVCALVVAALTAVGAVVDRVRPRVKRRRARERDTCP